MARHHRFIIFALGLSVGFLFMVPSPSLAYIGPGSGLELVPQFFYLLAFLGLALGSILLWPITTFYRFLRRKIRGNPVEVKTAQESAIPEEAPIVASLAETNGTAHRPEEAGIRPALLAEQGVRPAVLASESQGNGSAKQS